jgi:hypothetical protein
MVRDHAAALYRLQKQPPAIQIKHKRHTQPGLNHDSFDASSG